MFKPGDCFILRGHNWANLNYVLSIKDDSYITKFATIDEHPLDEWWDMDEDCFIHPIGVQHELYTDIFRELP